MASTVVSIPANTATELITGNDKKVIVRAGKGRVLVGGSDVDASNGFPLEGMLDLGEIDGTTTVYGFSEEAATVYVLEI